MALKISELQIPLVITRITLLLVLNQKQNTCLCLYAYIHMNVIKSFLLHIDCQILLLFSNFLHQLLTVVDQIYIYIRIKR